MDTLWYKRPDITDYLLEQDAGVNLSTHYGTSVREHFEYGVSINQLDKEKLLEAGRLLEQRFRSDEERAGKNQLMAAVTAGDATRVRQLLDAGADVNASEPMFGAGPLHKAVYNGHLAIAEMLAATPAVNLDSQECTNGYTALHDALWHGYRECAQVLIDAGARLDIEGHDGRPRRTSLTRCSGSITSSSVRSAPWPSPDRSEEGCKGRR